MKHPYPDIIALSLTLLLMTGVCLALPAGAEDWGGASGSQVSSLALMQTSAQKAKLVLSIEGEGFDPMVRWEPMSDGHYQVTIDLIGVSFSDPISQIQGALSAQCRRVFPTILAVTLFQTGQGEYQLSLTSSDPIHAQVLSNSGARIEIGLTQTTEKPRIAGMASSLKLSQPPRMGKLLPKAKSFEQPDRTFTPSGQQPAAPLVYDAPLKLPKISSIYAFELGGAPDAALKQAWDAYRQGQYQETIQYLKGYTSTHPKRLDAQHLLAVAYLGKGDKVEATQVLESLTSSSSPYLPAVLDLLTLRLEAGSWYQSDALVKKALAVWPEHPDLHYSKGLLNEAQGRLAEAKEEYVRALIVSPSHPLYHYRLAMVELKTNRPKAAKVELERVLMVTPDNADALKLLAYLAQKEDEQGMARQLYLQALKPDALISYASLLQKMNQPEQARQILKTALILAPSQSEVWFNVGMLLEEQGDTAEARAVLTQYLNQASPATEGPRISEAQNVLKRLGK